ncbi:MAG: class I SAM-dependent methyltransferase [Chloroflexi bacterium]|nr:class I SAM-dependent methyltransferase [Chloroflexota bacterium]
MEAYKQLVRDGYSHVAQQYLATRTIDSADVQLLSELLSRVPNGARVLDAGCGSGVPITRMLSQQCMVTGVDFSETQLTLARALVPKAQLVCADIAALSFAHESFDAICSYYAIIHVPRDDHRQLLADFQRMLKPNGFTLLCMGNGDTSGGTEQDWLGAPMYWSHFDAETNLQLLRDAGFAIIWAQTVSDMLDAKASHLFVLAQKRAMEEH